MFIVTRIDFGSVQERSYFRTYKHDGGYTHHTWTTERRDATAFDTSTGALTEMARHVPARNQHKCEVITL